MFVISFIIYSIYFYSDLKNIDQKNKFKNKSIIFVHSIILHLFIDYALNCPIQLSPIGSNSRMIYRTLAAVAIYSGSFNGTMVPDRLIDR